MTSLPETNKTPGDVLRRAITILAVRGWAQGAYLTLKGHMSVDYAIWIAAKGDGELRFKAYQYMQLAYREQRSVQRWNDDLGRDFKEVIKTLKEAAVLANKEE